jgi:hypothetical protein
VLSAIHNFREGVTQQEEDLLRDVEASGTTNLASEVKEYGKVIEEEVAHLDDAVHARALAEESDPTEMKNTSSELNQESAAASTCKAAKDCLDEATFRFRATGRKILTKCEDSSEPCPETGECPETYPDGVCPEADDGMTDDDSPRNDDGSPVEDEAPVDSSSTPEWTSDAHTKNYVFVVGPNIDNDDANSPEKCVMGRKNCEFKGWTQMRDNDLYQGFMKHPDVVNKVRSSRFGAYAISTGQCLIHLIPIFKSVATAPASIKPPT